MTSHTQTCITAGIWCVPKKYMNCHKVPLTFGDDKKQTDKTDYDSSKKAGVKFIHAVF